MYAGSKPSHPSILSLSPSLSSVSTVSSFSLYPSQFYGFNIYLLCDSDIHDVSDQKSWSYLVCLRGWGSKSALAKIPIVHHKQPPPQNYQWMKTTSSGIRTECCRFPDRRTTTSDSSFSRRPPCRKQANDYAPSTVVFLAPKWLLLSHLSPANGFYACSLLFSPEPSTAIHPRIIHRLVQKLSSLLSLYEREAWSSSVLSSSSSIRDPVSSESLRDTCRRSPKPPKNKSPKTRDSIVPLGIARVDPAR